VLRLGRIGTMRKQAEPLGVGTQAIGQ
jgi:hypothetical protein